MYLDTAYVAAATLGLRKTIFLRGGDGIHLTTASLEGFDEVWTSDRHMLAAARAFGIRGRSI